MKNSSIYETDQDVDYAYWSSNHSAHATLSISNSLQDTCMNLLHLNTRRSNVVGFDHEAAVKGIFQ
jgi:hypothetical protein